MQEHCYTAIQFRNNGCLLIREVEHSQKCLFSIGAGIVKDALVITFAVHPLETVIGMIQGSDSLLFQVQPIQFTDVAVEGIVDRQIQQIPVRFPAFIPFPEHGKLVTHKV